MDNSDLNLVAFVPHSTNGCPGQFAGPRCEQHVSESAMGSSAAKVRTGASAGIQSKLTLSAAFTATKFPLCVSEEPSVTCNGVLCLCSQLALKQPISG